VARDEERGEYVLEDMAKEKGMEHVTVRLPEELLKKVDGYAGEHEMTRSDVVREALEKFFSVVPAPQPPEPSPPVPGPLPGEIAELRRAVERLALEQGELRRYVEGLRAGQEEIKGHLAALGATDEEIKRYVGDLYGRTNQLHAGFCELVRRLVPVAPFPVPGPFPVPPWMM
jgi:hypothetical protein